jgi:hypothetical protein
MHLCRLQLTRLKTLLPRDTALIIESMKFAIGQPRLFILLHPQPQHNLEPLLSFKHSVLLCIPVAFIAIMTQQISLYQPYTTGRLS